jgi:hypothetical protein
MGDKSMTTELRELLQSQATDLLNQNCDGVAEELAAAADGKISVSMGFKLCLIGRKLVANGSISYARRFKDEVEGVAELPEPDQLRLPIEKET